MLRIFLIILCLLFSPATHAVEEETTQEIIDTNHVLRGHFVEEHGDRSSATPFTSSGHFVAAPGHGLIWSIEQPVPTTTIITPRGAAQDFGGLAIKLPIRNLAHLYEVIGNALAGNWIGAEQDFVISCKGDASAWQMLLTPRPDSPSKLGYTAITVSGHKFIENMALTKAAGGYDALVFSDLVLAPSALSAQERMLLNEVK